MDGEVPGSGRPVQFSLQAIFIVMTIVGVLCGLLIGGTPMVRWITGFVVALALPMLWIVMLVYGRGYQRTFGVGALFPSGLLLVGVGFFALGVVYEMTYRAVSWADFDKFGTRGGTGHAIIAGADLFLSLLFGLMAVGLRRAIESRR